MDDLGKRAVEYNRCGYGKKRDYKFLIFLIPAVIIVVAAIIFFLFLKSGVKNIELSDSLLTLNQGDGYELNYTINPKRADNGELNISWTSSDESVATVNQKGVVVAMEIGNCDIQAKTDNGKSDMCHIIVKGEDGAESHDSGVEDNKISQIEDNITSSEVIENPVLNLNFSKDDTKEKLRQPDSVWRFVICFCNYNNDMITLLNKFANDNYEKNLDSYNEYSLLMQDVSELTSASKLADSEDLSVMTEISFMLSNAGSSLKELDNLNFYAQNDRSRIQSCQDDLIAIIKVAYYQYTDVSV